MKAIMFLGTSLLGAQYISEATNALGYRPIFLLNIEEYSGDPKKAIERCEYYKADVNSVDDIRRAIEEHQFMDEVIGVTSLLDETLQNACTIAEQFGIAGPDAALSQLTDKALVREIIPEFSPPSFVFKLPEISAEDINGFFEAYNHFEEFVLKPGISSGAVGISILSRNVTKEQIEKCIIKSGIEGAKFQNWIIQPRITGRLHSLEGFVKNEKVYFLGFSRRIRKELTESITEFPVDKELSLSLQKYCHEAVKTLIQRSKYLNGYFHCEFIINAESAYFLDGNMGRVAGAAIVQQLALIYGKKPADIYKHVFDLGLFNGIHTQDFRYQKVNDNLTLSINYCLSKSAIVLDILKPVNLNSFHTQIAGNNRKMLPVGVSDSAWIGFLCGYRDTVLAEIQQIAIETDQGSIPPFYTLEEQQSSKNEDLNIVEGSH